MHISRGSRRIGSVAGIFVVAVAVPVVAAEDRPILEVAADGSAPYCSIQAAIDAAPKGAVIRIAPGTYEGSVNIPKPLTLEGAGWNQTKLTADWHDLGEMVRGKSEVPADRKARLDALAAKLKNSDGDEYAATLDALWREFGPKPTLTVRDAGGVVVKGLRVSMTGTVRAGGWQSAPMVLIEASEVRIDDCAFAGSPVEGMQIRGASNVDLHDSLVAGIRATGIDVETSQNARVRIVGCDVRHCGYSGVTVKGDGGTVVQECRISNVDYHGIRYDDASPEIVRNVFAAVNRAGIYADGKTRAVLRNNLFLGCGLWGGEGEIVEENTFVFQKVSSARSQPERAISLGDRSQSEIRRNVFVGHPIGVTFGGADADVPALEENVFDVTEMPLARWVPNDPNDVARQKRLAPSARSTPPGRFNNVPLPEGNRTAEIRFTDPQSGDYSLAGGTPLGARGYPAIESPWPELPEERDLVDCVAQAEADPRGSYQTGPRSPLEAPVPRSEK